MALLHLQSSFITNKPHPHLYKSLSYLPTRLKFTIICQDSTSSSSSSSQSSKPTIEEPPSQKPISPGQGFGSGSTQLPKSNASPAPGKKKGRRERASIIRRSPVEKPAFLDKKGEVETKDEQSLSESAFLLTWAVLGGVILVEGLALSASGFLPEKWDKFFVKFLYPSFTPTVGLFVAGTVVYGVLKYLQNDNMNNEK